jgi:curli biogenesis system outer membrane secretion channel CsgG
MLQVLVLGVLLVQGPASAGPPEKTAPVPQAAASVVKSETDDPIAILKIKRIFVDSFGDDIISKELQSMIVSSLAATKRFKVTENRDRADAILKGVALEKSSQEVHAYGEGTSVGSAGGHAEVHGRNGSGGFLAQHMGTSDSSVNTETINEARVAIRLVTPDGDVIWTSTQESKGAKYKGASADVADRCVKQLVHDVQKLDASNTSGSATASPSESETTSPKK